MIAEIITKQYVAEAAVKPSPTLWQRKNGHQLHVRASSLSDCTRALWYGLKQAPAAPVSVDIVRARYEGFEFEKRVLGILKKSGLDIRGVQKVLTKALDGVILHGHTDAILYICNEAYAVIDAKRQRFGRNDEIAAKHSLQLQAYMYMAGVDLGIVIADLKSSRYESYRGADNPLVSKQLREVPIRADLPGLRKRVAELKQVLVAEPERLVPVDHPELPVAVYSWKCLYCRYSAECLPDAKIITINGSPKLIQEK